MTKKSSKPEEIAFKDFKKSITKKEFEAILELAREEYGQLLRVKKKSEKFKKDTLDSLEQMKEGIPKNELENASRVIAAMTRQADAAMYKAFGDKIERLDIVVDFINRFQKPGEYLDKLNFKE